MVRKTTITKQGYKMVTESFEDMMKRLEKTGLVRKETPSEKRENTRIRKKNIAAKKAGTFRYDVD